jgi:hypothetical protein
MNLLKKIPSVVLFVLLALVYIGCGFIVGYHQGYKAGQEDYIIYINKLFESVKMQDFDKVDPKVPAADPKTK